MLGPAWARELGKKKGPACHYVDPKCPVNRCLMLSAAREPPVKTGENQDAHQRKNQCETNGH